MRAPGGAHRAWANPDHLKSVFDRKNIFIRPAAGLPDQPYKSPIVGEGELVDMPDGETVRVGIERLHLEQFFGSRCTTRTVDVAGRSQSRRRGAVEIVSKPDLRSADEARLCRETAASAVPRHLRRRHGEGQSARRRQRLGAQARRTKIINTRCEIKNVNSIHFIGRRSSMRRGARSASSRTAARSSRRRGCSIGQRRDVDAQQGGARLRYFRSDAPLELALASQFAQNLPEFRREEGASSWRLCAVHVRRRARAEARAANISSGRQRRRPGRQTAANWVINETDRRLNKEGNDIAACPVAKQLESILDLADGTISQDLRSFEIVWTKVATRAII